MGIASWAMLGFFVVLAVTTPRYGADSRGDPPRRQHTVRGDALALGALLRELVAQALSRSVRPAASRLSR